MKTASDRNAAIAETLQSVQERSNDAFAHLNNDDPTHALFKAQMATVDLLKEILEELQHQRVPNGPSS